MFRGTQDGSSSSKIHTYLNNEEEMDFSFSNKNHGCYARQGIATDMTDWGGRTEEMDKSSKATKITNNNILFLATSSNSVVV